MAYRATHRHARISARKVRPLANLIRGKRVDDALAILKYQPQRGARLVEKVLQSAFANADNEGAPNKAGLKVVEAKVDSGPMMKRLMPRSRGTANVIKRRFAHITVAVE